MYVKPGHKAVLFDWDDTLVSTIAAKFEEHKHIYKTIHGKELDESVLWAHWGKAIEDLVAEVHGKEHVATVFAHHERVSDFYPKLLWPGVLELLTRLKESDRRLGIITNTFRSGLVSDLDRLQIPQGTFDFLQATDDYEYRKPDPRVFDPALAELELEPSQILFVGDSWIDEEAAKSAGIDFVGVATGLHDAEDFAKRGVKAVKFLDQLF